LFSRRQAEPNTAPDSFAFAAKLEAIAAVDKPKGGRVHARGRRRLALSGSNIRMQPFPGRCATLVPGVQAVADLFASRRNENMIAQNTRCRGLAAL